MGIYRTKSWLFAWATVLLSSGTAMAQGMNGWAYGNAPYSNPRPDVPRNHADVQPFHPVDFEMPATPFAPADISDFGNGPPPKVGFFFSYERVYWSLSKPQVTAVGYSPIEDIPFPGGVLDTPEGNQTPARGPTPLVDEQNSFDTAFLQSDFTWGNRFDMGWMEDNDHGWLVSIIEGVRDTQVFDLEHATVLFDNPEGFLDPDYQDNNQDGIDDDLDGDFVFGRDGADTSIPHTGIPDTPAAVDTDDRQAYIPRFETFEIKQITKLNGVELMRVYRAPHHRSGSVFEFMYGVRYVSLEDKFSWFGVGGVLADSYSSTKINNNIVGPQLGARWSNQRGRWIVSAEGRFTAGFNMAQGRQRSLLASLAGYTTDIPPDITGTTPNAFNALRAYGSTAASYDETFAPVAELRLQTSYQITKAWALKVGYTAIFMDGISRASNRINYSVPAMGIRHENTNQDFFVNGVNFGVEFNR